MSGTTDTTRRTSTAKRRMRPEVGAVAEDVKCFRCGGFGHRANQCATPPKGKSKGKGRDGFKGGGKGQGGGHPCGHCGKTGHGPANCWKTRYRRRGPPLSRKRRRSGASGSTSAASRLLPRPDSAGRGVRGVCRDRLPEPREAQAGWEREDHDRQRCCGVGAASADVAGEETVEGESKRKGVRYVAATGGKMENHGEKRVRFRRNGSEAVNSITFQVTGVSKPRPSAGSLTRATPWCSAGRVRGRTSGTRRRAKRCRSSRTRERSSTDVEFLEPAGFSRQGP